MAFDRLKGANIFSNLGGRDNDDAGAVPAVSVIRCAAGKVLQTTKGRVTACEAIPDASFAAGILGEGVGIEPEEGVVVAPFDGVISTVAETGHAVGIEGGGAPRHGGGAAHKLRRHGKRRVRSAIIIEKTLTTRRIG